MISTEELDRALRPRARQRNPAQFDEAKLRWMNGRYMRELSLEELTRRRALEASIRGAPDARPAALAGVRSAGEDPDARGLLAAGGLLLRRARSRRNRRRRASAGSGETRRARCWRRGRATRAALAQARASTRQGVRRRWWDRQQRRGVKPRDVYQPLRVALTGTTSRRGSSRASALLGHEQTLSGSTPRSPSGPELGAPGGAAAKLLWLCRRAPRRTS